MDGNVYKVLRGFAKLTEAEKKLFIRELNRYEHASYLEKSQLNEIYNAKSNTSAKDSICTCCGR
jgi:hypothetical protein